MNVETFRNLLKRDGRADRVVPPTGYTAHLTLFVSGAMGFLAVFALALSLASGRVADRWASELAGAATVRINAPADQMAAQTETALTVLSQTPGVASARALTIEEQIALLSPWFGPDLPLDTLPVPQLIEIFEGEPGLDAAGLRLRLGAEVPGAVLDDHSRWREPLVDAARSLRRLGWVSILLIGGATAAMITLAANASLAANAQIIEVLRLVGARDRFIANAFVRRFTYRAFFGAMVGVLFGMTGVLLLPEASSDEGGFLTGLGFQGAGWLLPALIPVLGAAVAFLATWTAANRKLKELS
ncbi:cell division protein FtsX [Ruegeria faecimaris]|uniref:Cell division transport system permease protein n=1 Tax=Ruegeria faecimaris TaxID=686389 RepID=A0A521C5E8_9RHOB|nr:FtsX-like permease family protein [Ruegeria faecimaris]SMO54638.1 cell division transport system permease protein [Ruegeria faecimaris]